MQTAVRMDWITPQWTCPWRTVQGSWWMVLRGPMTGSSSAATATMPPEAQQDSSSTSESTQVSVNTSFSGDNNDEVLLLSRFFLIQERNLTAATCAHLLRPTSGTWKPTCDHTPARNLISVSCAPSAAVIVATCRTIADDATNSCQ